MISSALIFHCVAAVVIAVLLWLVVLKQNLLNFAARLLQSEQKFLMTPSVFFRNFCQLNQITFVMSDSTPKELMAISGSKILQAHLQLRFKMIQMAGRRIMIQCVEKNENLSVFQQSVEEALGRKFNVEIS